MITIRRPVAETVNFAHPASQGIAKVGAAKQYITEFLGSLWVVLCGCGTAILAAQNPQLGMSSGTLALAFGAALTSAAYAGGPYCMSYFNPAIATALLAAGRLPATRALGCILAQVLGAIAGAELLVLIASGKPGFNLAISGLAANGYAEHSPTGYGLTAAWVAESALSVVLVTVALRIIADHAHRELTALVMGLTLVAINLISLPLTNGSVNPARSTGPALLMGGWALSQLWVFWVVPVGTALLVGFIYRVLNGWVSGQRASRATHEPQQKMNRQRRNVM